jgi:hypothetical protein
MTNPFYGLVFVLYKLFLRPFKRTPARWSAIIFDDEGRFAVDQNPAGRRLPSGRIKAGSSIPHLCRNELGLDQSCFASKGQLRLIGIEGRGGEEFSFYLSGEIVRAMAQVRRLENRVSFVEKSELGLFVPDDIGIELRAKAG